MRAFTMTQPTVLISSAGIAGRALAILAGEKRIPRGRGRVRTGHPPRRSDRRPARRSADVVRRMGLLNELTRSLDQRGIAWAL